MGLFQSRSLDDIDPSGKYNTYIERNHVYFQILLMTSILGLLTNGLICVMRYYSITLHYSCYYSPHKEREGYTMDHAPFHDMAQDHHPIRKKLGRSIEICDFDKYFCDFL